MPESILSAYSESRVQEVAYGVERNFTWKRFVRFVLGESHFVRELTCLVFFNSIYSLFP